MVRLHGIVRLTQTSLKVSHAVQHPNTHAVTTCAFIVAIHRQTVHMARRRASH